MKPTVFFHVPKTAGSSFVREVVKEYGDNNSANYDQSVARRGTAANLVSAHVPFHYMEPLMDGTVEKRFSFTIIRDPVERVWSFCRYKAAQVGNNHHPPEEFLFDDGVASTRQQFNRFVTQLGGDFYLLKDMDATEYPMEQWLENALKNMERLDAIYWVEDPEWQQKLWADTKLDWEGEVFHNVSEFQDDMTPAQQERAITLTQWDRIFYNELKANAGLD